LAQEAFFSNLLPERREIRWSERRKESFFCMSNKYRVVVTEPVIDEGLEKLKEVADLTILERGSVTTEEDVIRELKGFDGAITMLSNPVTEKVFASLPELKVIGNHAVGYNNIDIKAAQKHNVVIGNTPDVLTDSTADLTVGLLLAVTRKIPEADQFIREEKFDGWEPRGFLGLELNGKTLGIVGMGRIGKAVAKRLNAFGMNIIYHNRNQVSNEIERSLNARYVDEMGDLLEKSDIISIHCPLNEETYHLIDENRIKKFLKDTVIINTARGPVVDEAALAEALISGHIAGAGLDVFEKEPEVHPKLLKSPNTVLLPHIGSATNHTRKRMTELAADAVYYVLSGRLEELETRVV
jgi:glyoxylate reductase